MPKKLSKNAKPLNKVRIFVLLFWSFQNAMSILELLKVEVEASLGMERQSLHAQLSVYSVLDFVINWMWMISLVDVVVTMILLVLVLHCLLLTVFL